MRPPRQDIGAPEFPGTVKWIGDPPESMAVAAAAGPVLVQFIDFAQLNSVRTLPYLVEWDARYRDLGLTTLAVQTPRLPFTADASATSSAMNRLGIEFSVAVDLKRDMWQDYGCEGWPSLFLWSQGAALRWFHFGEGEYAATEEAIQDELRETNALVSLPPVMEPVRATDEPGATVIAPTQEFFPAGDRPWTAEQDDPELTVTYEAGGAWATVDGAGRIEVEVDGIKHRPVVVPGPGVYKLTEDGIHGRHAIRLELDPGIKLWSIAFPAGVPSS